MDIFQAYKSILNFSTEEINFPDIKVTKNPKSLSHLCTPNLLIGIHYFMLEVSILTTSKKSLPVSQLINTPGKVWNNRIRAKKRCE